MPNGYFTGTDKRPSTSILMRGLPVRQSANPQAGCDFHTGNLQNMSFTFKTSRKTISSDQRNSPEKGFAAFESEYFRDDGAVVAAAPAVFVAADSIACVVGANCIGESKASRLDLNSTRTLSFYSFKPVEERVNVIHFTVWPICLGKKYVDIKSL